MINLGDRKYGSAIYVPFATYGANGESITISNFAVGDIAVYKDGSVTQRASTAGYALLDTDGIDFDAVTGIHGFSIDTSDNTTAGFWAPGHDYWIVVGPFTVNAQTVNFVYYLSLENAHDDRVLVRTSIASLSSQTSFTLTAGSADNSAYVGCVAVIQDQASTVQKAVGVVSAYTGSTKTVTLLADPGIFTMATGDYITVLADRSLKPTVDNRTLDVSAGGEGGVDWGNVGSKTTTVDLSGTTIATGQTIAGVTTVTNLTNAATAGDLTTTMKASVKTQVVDAIGTDTITEQAQGAPPAAPTLKQIVSYLYMLLVRNKKLVDASGSPAVEKLYANDDSTVVMKRDITDSANVTTAAKTVTGP